MSKSSRRRKQASTKARPTPTSTTPTTTTASTGAAAPVTSSPPPTTASARARTPRRRQPAQKSIWERYRSAIIAGVVGVAVLIVAFVFLQSGGKAYACDSQLAPDPSQTADPNALGFVTEDLGQSHVAGGRISYAYCPPASGGHYNAANRGPIRNAVYPASNEQAPGGWIHNLEHGAVVLLYRCPSGTLGTGDCATTEEMAEMQEWFSSAPVVNNCAKQAIVARFDDMATRFAVLSWNRALLVDTFDLAQARAFAQQWTDVTAPEAERLVCS